MKFLQFVMMFLSIEATPEVLSQNQSPGQTDQTTIAPKTSVVMDSKVDESSGLFIWNDTIWTHNDSEQTTFYAIDPVNGQIIKQVTIPGITIEDWEETAQDDRYLYLGDFGNNSTGIRQNLRVFKIDKLSAGSGTPIIDTIKFSYPQQTDFSTQTSNQTDFDCEAFIVTTDSIYLFTKQWNSLGTSVYALPKTRGNYEAKLISTFPVNGLITGATSINNGKTIVLVGYGFLLDPFLLILSEYENNHFFSGKVTRIAIQLSFHQVEAIAKKNGSTFYITNESSNLFGQTPGKIHTIDLSSFLSSTGMVFQSGFDIFPNPTTNLFTISCTDFNQATDFRLYDLTGRYLKSGPVTGWTTPVDLSDLPFGTYLLKVSSSTGYCSKIVKSPATR